MRCPFAIPNASPASYFREAFTHSVKRARTLVEESMVKRSMGNNAAGAIFVLKNMGYSDRHSVQVDPIKILISGVDAQF